MLTFVRQKLTSSIEKKNLKMRGTQTLKKRKILLKRKQRKNFAFKQDVEACSDIHRHTDEG